MANPCPALTRDCLNKNMAIKYESGLVRTEADLEDYAIQCGVSLRISPLKGGVIKVKHDSYFLGDMLVCTWVSPTGWAFEKLEDTDRYYFSIASSGHAEVNVPTIGPLQAKGEAYFIDGCNIDSGKFSPGVVLESIIINSKKVHAELEKYQGDCFKGRVNVGSMPFINKKNWQTLSSISMAIQKVVNSTGEPYIAAAYLQSALLTSIFEMFPSLQERNYSLGNARVCPGVLRRAVEFMNEHAALPIGLADIANASGTSGRNLQLLFKASQDVSPMSKLRDIRLDRCRLEFEIGDFPVDVWGVAKKWGFIYRALFEKYYRRRYGESPFDTLARRKRY